MRWNNKLTWVGATRLDVVLLVCYLQATTAPQAVPAAFSQVTFGAGPKPSGFGFGGAPAATAGMYSER